MQSSNQIIIIIISDLHHYKCVSATGRQQPPEWSVLGQVDCFCPRQPVIQVICSRPISPFQYTEGKEVKICLASILSSIWSICPNKVRCGTWIISVSRGWLAWRQTLSLVMKWYHLMPRSILTYRDTIDGGHWSCMSNHHHQQTNTKLFYRPDTLPVTQPTVSKHWREKYHIPWTCLPQVHLGVFQLCLWPLIAPGYVRGGLPCLSSALWCQYPIE